MMWMTVYIGWSWEKTKIIEAQWCATSLWWKINNYVYYTLTSKMLELTDKSMISPDFYFIWLTWWNAQNDGVNCTVNNASQWQLCNKIIFAYSTWDTNTPKIYQTITVWDTCRQAQPNLWFYRSWTTSNNIPYIKMNKWFSPVDINEMKVFHLQNWQKDLLGDIVIVLCFTDTCDSDNQKEVAKWSIDWRSQTISLKKCRFYDDTHINKCREREL